MALVSLLTEKYHNSCEKIKLGALCDPCLALFNVHRHTDWRDKGNEIWRDVSFVASRFQTDYLRVPLGINKTWFPHLTNKSGANKTDASSIKVTIITSQVQHRSAALTNMVFSPTLDWNQLQRLIQKDAFLLSYSLAIDSTPTDLVNILQLNRNVGSAEESSLLVQKQIKRTLL